MCKPQKNVISIIDSGISREAIETFIKQNPEYKDLVKIDWFSFDFYEHNEKDVQEFRETIKTIKDGKNKHYPISDHGTLVLSVILQDLYIIKKYYEEYFPELNISFPVQIFDCPILLINNNDETKHYSSGGSGPFGEMIFDENHNHSINYSYSEVIDFNNDYEMKTDKGKYYFRKTYSLANYEEELNDLILNKNYFIPASGNQIFSICPQNTSLNSQEINSIYSIVASGFLSKNERYKPIPSSLNFLSLPYNSNCINLDGKVERYEGTSFSAPRLTVNQWVLQACFPNNNLDNSKNILLHSSRVVPKSKQKYSHYFRSFLQLNQKKKFLSDKSLKRIEECQKNLSTVRPNFSQNKVNGQSYQFCEYTGFGSQENQKDLSYQTIINHAQTWPDNTLIQENDLVFHMQKVELDGWKSNSINLDFSSIPIGSEIRTISIILKSPNLPLSELSELSLSSPNNAKSYLVPYTGSPYFWINEEIPYYVMKKNICVSEAAFKSFISQANNYVQGYKHMTQHHFHTVHFQGVELTKSNQKNWKCEFQFEMDKLANLPDSFFWSPKPPKKDAFVEIGDWSKRQKYVKWSAKIDRSTIDPKPYIQKQKEQYVNKTFDFPVYLEINVQYVKPEKAQNNVYTYSKDLINAPRNSEITDTSLGNTILASDWSYNQLTSEHEPKDYVKTKGCLININSGEKSYFYWTDLNGVDQQHTLYIAKTAKVNDATSGFDNDTLIDNPLDNVLNGRQGDDVLKFLHGGFDQAIGHKGKDQFIVDTSKKTILLVEDDTQSPGKISLLNTDMSKAFISFQNDYCILKHKDCFVFFSPQTIASVEMDSKSYTTNLLASSKLSKNKNLIKPGFKQNNFEMSKADCEKLLEDKSLKFELLSDYFKK